MMAARPWASPDDVIAYTENAGVKNRPVEKLAFDIFRAEQKVISKTHNPFTDEQYADGIPEPVKKAIILIAELYARNAIESGKEHPNLKSESFDDYSYTVDDSANNVDSLDIDDLLSDYVLPVGRNKTVMRLRKL